mmetsp:Transcript_30374/g.77502  ORF Transcript_30374/g.77502 Transcript_30374/m.77502 type:complete len:87 (-) Transcript_30374:2433-2693(-)
MKSYTPSYVLVWSASSHIPESSGPKDSAASERMSTSLSWEAGPPSQTRAGSAPATPACPAGRWRSATRAAAAQTAHAAAAAAWAPS